jgi:protein TonB
MKNTTLIFVLQMAFLYGSRAQNNMSATSPNCTQKYDATLQKRIYTYVDKMPEFKGGELGLMKFFRDHFRYPKDQEFFQGSIDLVFVVEANGQVQNGHIVNKSDASLTLVDKEALRVLRSMPKWKAGSCNGKYVPVRMFWPIRF